MHVLTRRVLPALFLLVASLLAGCGALPKLWGEEDTAEPPTPLAPFEQTLAVKTLWRRDVGRGAKKQYIKLMPAVDGVSVFAADRKGRVKAYDARNGEILWETDVDVPIASGPSVGDNLVLVGSSDGDVLALAPESGDELWRTRVSSEVLAAPQASQGVAVVRTVDGKLYGLDTTGGTQLWVYDRTVPALTLRGTSAPVLVGEAVVCGFDSGRLAAISLFSGTTFWETRITVPRGRSELERLVDIDAEPMIAGNVVYVVTFQGRIAALDLRSGTMLWRRDMSSHAGIGLDRNILYVTDDLSQVWALDRFNSASLWRQSKLKGRGLTSPVAFGDYVVVGDFEGYVHWLRRDDGQFAARVRVDGDGIIAPPLATRDTLYVYGRGGTLAALQVGRP